MRLYKEFSENCKDQPHDVQNTLNSTYNFQTKKQINLNLPIRKRVRTQTSLEESEHYQLYLLNQPESVSVQS